MQLRDRAHAYSAQGPGFNPNTEKGAINNSIAVLSSVIIIPIHSAVS